MTKSQVTLSQQKFRDTLCPACQQGGMIETMIETRIETRMPSVSIMPPCCWILTETPPEPGEVMRYMNILARKNFRLINPDDPAQVLYCTCDKHRKADGSLHWQKRYGGSTQANGALLRAWEPRDGWSDDAGTKENLVKTAARLFQEASARKKLGT